MDGRASRGQIETQLSEVYSSLYQQAKYQYERYDIQKTKEVSDLIYYSVGKDRPHSYHLFFAVSLIQFDTSEDQ